MREGKWDKHRAVQYFDIAHYLVRACPGCCLRLCRPLPRLAGIGDVTCCGTRQPACPVPHTPVHRQQCMRWHCALLRMQVGWPAGAFTLLITIISLSSTSLAQIVAISTGLYYIDTRIDKLCAAPPMASRGMRRWPSNGRTACVRLLSAINRKASRIRS